MSEIGELRRRGLERQVAAHLRKARGAPAVGRPVIDLGKALAASAGAVVTVCYAVGYLIGVGYSRKLGLPVSVHDYEIFLARGASFPLGLAANLVISYGRAVGLTGTVLVGATLAGAWALFRMPPVTAGVRRVAAAVASHGALASVLLALVVVVFSLYMSWKPTQEQGLLLDRPAYMADLIRHWTEAIHLKEQLRLDIAGAGAERDEVRRAVLNDRVEKARVNVTALDRTLAAERVLVTRDHELVYCTYFQGTDPRCGGVRSDRYSALCMLVAAAFAATYLAFRAAGGRFCVALAGVTVLLVLNTALVLVDYGWLLVDTEVPVVSRQGDAAEMLLLGEHGDRFLFYRFEPPAVLMTPKSATPELSVHRRAELFSEILRSAAHGNQ